MKLALKEGRCPTVVRSELVDGVLPTASFNKLTTIFHMFVNVILLEDSFLMMYVRSLR